MVNNNFITEEEIKEFARKHNLPNQGLLDYLSRADEVMIANLMMLYRLEQKLGVSPAVPGMLGDRLTMVPSMKDLSLKELRDRLESGAFRPYQVHNIDDMTTAQDNLEIPIEGDSLSCWTNGSYAGIGVRFNNKNSDIVYFSRVNPIRTVPFWKVYLTHGSQVGKSMSLFAGRQFSAIPSFPINAAAILQPFHSVKTDKDTHFTGAIVQWATEEENLGGLIANKVRITGIAIQSDQQLDYRVVLFSRDTFANADLDVDTFYTEVELDMVSYGFQIAGAGQYYMAVNGLSVDYEDLDGSGELHIALQNLSAVAKNAGATGEVRLEFVYEERA